MSAKGNWSTSSTSSDEEKAPSVNSSKTTPKGQASKNTAYNRVDQAKNTSAKNPTADAKPKPPTKSPKEPIKMERKGEKDAKKKDATVVAKDKKKEDDTVVIVSQPPTPVDETGRKKFPLPETKPPASVSSAASSVTQTGSSFAGEELDEDLAKLDQEMRSEDRDTTTTNLRSISTMGDLSNTSSITSSMVEVPNPDAVRDSMLATSTFEEIQHEKNGGREEGGSSGSGSEDGDDKPLSECHVDEVTVEEQDGRSCLGKFVSTYWCSLMFAPVVMGTVIAVVGRSIKAYRSSCWLLLFYRRIYWNLRDRI